MYGANIKRKLTAKMSLKYANSAATFPAGRPGLKVEKNETFMSRAS